MQALAISGSNIFAGADDGDVFLSTDNGSSWTAVNAGLPNTNVLSLAINGNNLFAGTYGNAVWKRPLLQMTKIEELNLSAQDKAIIYLNPFTHTTNITLNVNDRNLKLEIFDLLGKKTYQRNLSSKQEILSLNLPDGIYFYKIASDKLPVAQGKLVIQ